MHGYLSLDIIGSEKRTVFRERSSRKTVSFEEQILSKDKYPCIFLKPNGSNIFFFLQGRILGDLSKKICQRSNIISLLKVFSFIHLYDLLGIKAKRAKVNRRVPKLGNIICYYSTKSRDAHIWSESHCYSYCWLSTILYQRRAHGIIDKL